MPSVILHPPRKPRASEDSGEAERIARHYVDTAQEPLALLHQGKTFESVARESCVRAAESDGDQQPPARGEQGAFGGEDEKESEDEAAGKVDDQCAIGKRGREIAGNQIAEAVAGARSDNGAERDPEIVQDGVLLQRFCRSYQPERRLTANPIASGSV